MCRSLTSQDEQGGAVCTRLSHLCKPRKGGPPASLFNPGTWATRHEHFFFRRCFSLSVTRRQPNVAAQLPAGGDVSCLNPMP